jgi:hypothetical protein
MMWQLTTTTTLHKRDATVRVEVEGNTGEVRPLFFTLFLFSIYHKQRFRVWGGCNTTPPVFDAIGVGFNPFHPFSTRTGWAQPPPLLFDTIRRERGGFNTTPALFDPFRRERSGFNPTPLLFDTIRRERGGVEEPNPPLFDRIRRERGGLNPTPLPFDAIRRERGGFIPTPHILDTF